MTVPAMDLTDPNVFSASDGPPHEFFTQLRHEAPVWFNPPPADPGTGALQIRHGFWVLTRHDDVTAVSHDAQTFSSWKGSPLIWDVEYDEVLGLEGQRAGLMGKDPPDHTKLRRLVQPGFGPKIVAPLEPKIRAHARRIVATAREMGEFDAVRHLAAELPVVMLCELMGIPGADWEKIFAWGNAAADLEGSAERNVEGALALLTYCNELVVAKRAAPDGSALSIYATTPVDGELLTDIEISLFFLTLSIAGHETTRNTLLHTLRLLDAHPEQRALVLDDLPTRLPNAIDEVLRFCPPVMQFRRTATVDTEIRGTPIADGDKVYLAYASANRDEAVFDDPQQFDVLRANAKRHLSFGVGAHFCMGAPLARMQLRCLLQEIFTAMPDIAPAGPVRRLPSIWFNAIGAMPMRA